MDLDRLVDSLSSAVKAEYDGHYFYLMAARLTQDEKGRAIFEKLAEEELEHVRALKQYMEQLQRDGVVGREVEMEDKRHERTSPIFSDDLTLRIADAHFEMTSLSVGMQLELSSQQFYREQAEATGDPVLKGFFAELSDWEAGHYETLRNQYESLRREYWEANSFAQF